MKILVGFLLALAALAVGLVAAGQFGLLRGRAPEDIGVKDSRLKPPSMTPNSVSSQADLYPDHPQVNYARIAPLQINGDADKAMARVADILKNSDATTIVIQKPDYIYAQSSTALLKFTDDVEFSLDRSAGLVHVRSASRLGRKDFGVNRQRVETIRAQFLGN